MQNFGAGDWGGKQGVLWRCANDEYDIYYVKKCCCGNGSFCIRHWAFGNADLTAMICFSDHQTTASQCAMQ